MSRFARQMALPEIGKQGQARLSAAHVSVIGAGGLGCPVLQYLAGAGVGQITLFDPDHVEESNLHRQPLYDMRDLGRPKVIAARDHLRAAHPGLRLEAHVQALGPVDAAGVAGGSDLVIDAADSFAVSYILSDACLTARTPLISASVLGQSGYAGGFCGSAPSLRAVFPDLPANSATCASNGVMGPVVGMIGAMQAQMALQVLLGQEPSPLGRVVSVDTRTMRFGGFAFHGTREPDGFFPFLSQRDITPRDHVIELRDEAEAPFPAFAHARRLTAEAVAAFTPDPGRRVVLCCDTGLRAWRAAALLAARGHRDLALLAARAGG